MKSKPKHFLIFKMVGAVGIIAAVTGVILTIKGFGDFESNNFMIGSFAAVFGVMAASIGITIGFGPEIARAKAKSVRYIQEENKEDMTAIASNTAQIISDAVATTAGAFSEGMRKTKFCKHCGTEIDSDSKFCSSCGKEQ